VNERDRIAKPDKAAKKKAAKELKQMSKMERLRLMFPKNRKVRK